MSEMIEQVQEEQVQAEQVSGDLVKAEAAEVAASPALPKRVVMRPDGYKEIRVQDGKEELVSLPEEKFELLPKKFRDKHFDVLRYVWGFGQLLVNRNQREIPIIRQELEETGVEKSVLKQLESFGYIDMPLVTLTRQGQSIGTRSAVVITPKGQGLISHVMGAIEGEMAAEAAPATEAPAEVAQEAAPAQAAQEAPAEVVAVEPVAVVAAEVVDGN